jgi:2,5-diketo-D-gluconate reductase A
MPSHWKNYSSPISTHNLIHLPFGDVHGAWRAMEELYRDDKVQAIGISNFHPDSVMDIIMGNEVVLAIDQIEVNPFYRRDEDQKFLQENKVQAEAEAPFAEGRNNLFQNDILVAIGKKHDKSVAQVVLRIGCEIMRVMYESD